MKIDHELYDELLKEKAKYIAYCNSNHKYGPHFETVHIIRFLLHKKLFHIHAAIYTALSFNNIYKEKLYKELNRHNKN